MSTSSESRQQAPAAAPAAPAGARASGYAVLVGSNRRRLCALAAASPRLATPSLPRMFDTWTLAVLGEMNSSPAISRLLRPAATRRSTSSSRSVSPSPSPPPPAPPSPATAAPDPSPPSSRIRARRARIAICSPSDRAPSRAASGAARCSRSAAPSRSPQASAASAACSSVSPSGWGSPSPSHALAASSQAASSRPPGQDRHPASRTASGKPAISRAASASAAANVRAKARCSGPNLSSFSATVRSLSATA